MRHRTGDEEQQAGDDTVGDHADDGGVDADLGERGDAQHHKAHVPDRRERNKALHVGLRQTGERCIDDADDGQDADCRSPVLRLFGEDRNGDPHKGVCAQFQQDGSQQHGADRRCGGVCVGEPGVEREHRHLDGEAKEQGGKHPEGELAQLCFGGASGERHHVEGVHAALEVDSQETKQHEGGAEQGEQEELDAGVKPHLCLEPDDRDLHLVAVTPDTDHEVHRQQHDLEEHEEQNQVERHEGAVHSGGEHQDERREDLRIVWLGPVVPRVDDRQHRHEAGEHQEWEADAVNANRIV